MARTVRIALLQLPAFSIEEAEASLAHTLRRIDDAARERPDIVVLPEGTYPAYFLGTRDLRGRGLPASDEIVARFAAKAREHAIYIAAGLAVEADGGYENAAMLFGRDGQVVGRSAKSFLWHFDNRWFTAGGAYPVFETDMARVGMLVCADGRLPEIARSLALDGAQIILDLTAWVSDGRHPYQLTSTQREYLMRCRAAENGVWVAAADKFGVEAESIVYCGRSCVISPQGEDVATLGPEEDAVLVCDVPVIDSEPPVARRPELYEVLTHPTESLPVVRALDEPFVMAEQERRIAVVQMTMLPGSARFAEAARRHVERLSLQDADVVAFPAAPATGYAHDDVLAAMLRLAENTKMCIAFALWEQGGYRTGYLVGPRGVVLRHRQSHAEPGAPPAGIRLGDETCAVANTPIGRVGLMLSAEGFVPEVARSLMLRGAEFILWLADDPPLPMAPFVRTRAEENRVFVASAATPTAHGATMVADPSGRPLATALEGRDLAVAAGVNRALSHVKERAPGTDVVRNRQPATYGVLTRPEPVAGRVV